MNTTGPPPARERGFTVIELLVVVIVIGILASIAVPAYLRQQDKAATATTKSHMRSQVLMIVSARDNRQRALKDITSVCSYCACRDAVTPRQVKDPAFAATACGNSWRAYVDRLAAASGEPVTVMERLATDGWGYPMIADENEGEYGVCGDASNWDTIISTGPDHTSTTYADNINFRVPPTGGCTI